jgi:hypothetical protein
MSIYILPKTVIKEMDKVSRTFFGKEAIPGGSIIWLSGSKYVKARRKGASGLKM